MREILFRGKRKDNGEWVENHTVVELRDGQKYIPNNFAPSGLKIDENGNKVSFVALFHEVIPETVGQYTGLTDKNGKKIFEGDIIKNTWTGDTHTVDWCVDCAVWVLPCITDERRETTFGSYDGDDYEVIGNIHDNPELLKGGAE